MSSHIQDVNAILEKNDENELFTHLTTEYEQDQEYQLFKYCVYKLASENSFLKKLADKFYTIVDILELDDLKNFIKIAKIKNADDAEYYFEDGGPQIKKYIVTTYPKFIKRSFFKNAAEHCDLEMLKLLHSNYKQKIEWSEIACFLIQNFEDDKDDDTNEKFDTDMNFFIEQGVDMKSNIQLFLMIAIKTQCFYTIQYFIDKGANLNARFDDLLPLEIADSKELANLLIQKGADIKLIFQENMQNQMVYKYINKKK